MLHTTQGFSGACVAPHHQASMVGRDVLREGGDAMEAMVAMAAAIAVCYPHMNSLGGDGFWLVKPASQSPFAIQACGPAAAKADLAFYRDSSAIPERGPQAAMTVAGTVSGWQRALEQSARHKGGPGLPLHRLLAPAIALARDGVAVTQSQSQLTRDKFDQLAGVPGFAEAYMVAGDSPSTGYRLRQPQLAATLDHLAVAGLDDFYRGDLAHSIGRDLQTAGSPLAASDLAAYQAVVQEPLVLNLKSGSLYNLAPPTQGLASLLILGQFEQLLADNPTMTGDSFDHVHGLVEATKQAFLVRDRTCLDPAFQSEAGDPQQWLSRSALSQMADRIDLAKAAPWPHPTQPGDTVWLGCIDAHGNAVSFIQSLYWEFGSGLCLPETGLLWQNRGVSFSLDPRHLNYLQPGKLPFHTLNPALAELADGRVMPYGTMGGEGQPQTQSAIYSRHVHFRQPLQQAITAPRWLLGRTWGEDSTRLKLEHRFDPALVEQLSMAGHDLELLSDDFATQMGHAGALIRHPDGLIEAAVDPRSDGAALLV